MALRESHTAGFRTTLVIPLEDDGPEVEHGAHFLILYYPLNNEFHNLSKALSNGQMLAVFPNGSFHFIPAATGGGRNHSPQ
jgi:hypothetical protein